MGSIVAGSLSPRGVIDCKLFAYMVLLSLISGHSCNSFPEQLAVTFLVKKVQRQEPAVNSCIPFNEVI
jgi:hypothetical protein